MDWFVVDERIDELEELAGQVLEGDGSWRDFWDEVRSIGSCFKGPDLRYPSREKRSEAWDRFQGIVSRTKKASEEQSEELRDEIIENLDSIELPFDSAGADLVIGFFSAVVAPGLPRPESTAKTALRSAQEQLSESRARYHEVKRRLTREDNDAVWKRLQEVQNELQGGWETVNASENEERLSRLEGAKTSRLEELERQQDRRRRVQENIEANEERFENARGDDFREKVEGWLAEGREQLERLDEKIEALEEAIREIEEKIDSFE